MANPKSKLKAFVRLDGSGDVIGNSVIYRKQKPRQGRYIEITKNPCCEYVAPTVESIAAVADPTSIEVGATSILTVTATLSDASTQDVTADATYSSSDEAIATVATDGTVTGISSGDVTISIIYRAKSTSVGITVTAEE